MSLPSQALFDLINQAVNDLFFAIFGGSRHSKTAPLSTSTKLLLSANAVVDICRYIDIFEQERKLQLVPGKRTDSSQSR